MISAAEMTAMQATVTASLPDTCTLILDTLASDGAGGQTATPNPSPPSVACRLWPIRLNRSAMAEVIKDARVTEESTWVVTLPFGTTVDPRYRIGNAGREFEVSEVLGPRSFGVDVRLLCRLIDVGAG
ncbi:MAG: head-tail adaptor protein [Candidatus Limnocylindrales bacterium]